MALERGTLLNHRYRIVEILGQGGMGSVYRAIDENLGVEVAVKDNLFTTDEYARQFRREAIILANLRHPNLPRVTDHFVIEGQGQYLVMDYIEGEDLRQRMDRVGTLTGEEVIVIGAAVCDALSYLDSRKPPIVHRDIKPGNVKITSLGQIFLVDFGLAKMMDPAQATTTGARAMTPGYSPPEQYGTARTDQRSDIFSLGATLYAALTGAIPEDALARAMDQTELTSVRKRNSQVSRRLAAVIEKSLAVRPDDRFQDAQEFKDALLGARSNTRRRDKEMTVTPPPMAEDRPLPGDDPHLPPEVAAELPRTSSPAPSGGSLLSVSSTFDSVPPPRRNTGRRSNVLALALVALLLLGGGVAAYVVNPRLPRQALARFVPAAWLPATATPTHTPEPIEPTHAPGSEALETDTPPPSLTPTTTPDDAATAYPVPGAADLPSPTPSPTNTLQPSPTPQPTAQGGGMGQLAYASDQTGENQIYLINSDGTNNTRITNLPGGACQPDWSPDGQRLVFISPCDSNHDLYPGAAMFLINADGTGLAPIPTMPGGDFDPSWSPDGSKIAFTSMRNSGRPQIYTYLLADSTFTQLSEKYSTDFQPAWSPDGKTIVFVTTRRGFYQVWLMDADGKNQHLVSRLTDLFDTHPHWSPDGTFVLFTQSTSLGGIPRQMMIALGGETPSEYRLSQDQLPMREGRFSTDGLWVVFEGWPANSNHDIYMIAVNGAARTQITTQPRNDFDAVWRPALP